ncbi:MAG TPA: hypothetical protein VD864_04780 [Nocardioides sp.]|nr:hypothetical protein [Nocardioides sp.]
MESDEIRQALHEAERAEAAPWTDRPLPWWVAPATGAFAGLALLAFWFDRLLYSVVPLAWGLGVGWVQRRRGIVPRGLSPREYWRPTAILATLLIVTAGLAFLLWRRVDPPAAAAVTAVLVTIAFAWYQRAYARAAERTKARLA